MRIKEGMEIDVLRYPNELIQLAAEEMGEVFVINMTPEEALKLSRKLVKKASEILFPEEDDVSLEEDCERCAGGLQPGCFCSVCGRGRFA